MRRPRLLHVTTTAISLDWLLAPQLHAFADAGFEICTVSAGGEHVDSLTAQGIKHVAAPSLSRNMELLGDARAASELRKLFTALRPDIVHTHNPKPGVLGRLIAKTCQVPIVVNTVHGLYAQPTDGLLRRSAVYGIERVAASCSHAELVQNSEDAATLARLGVRADRLHLLGNGIDLERFSPTASSRAGARLIRRELGIGADVPVIGMIGRLVWEKGYQEFFDAITELRARRHSPFEVVVVGPNELGKAGAVDQEAIDRMRGLGVKFLGARTDVPALLSAFDVFVLPSYREGFPRAAMEASAMGVPVVATDIRGCRQVVIDGETGLLVQPRESRGLCDALSMLLADPQLRAKLGAAGSRRASSEFDQGRVIARTLAVYRHLLRVAGLPAPQAVTSRYKNSIDLVAFEASKRLAELSAPVANC